MDYIKKDDIVRVKDKFGGTIEYTKYLPTDRFKL